MRRSIFRNVPLPGKVDGRRQATVIIEQNEESGDGLVRVRPLRGREYTLPLGSVAEGVCWRVAKAERGK